MRDIHESVFVHYSMMSPLTYAEFKYNHHCQNSPHSSDSEAIIERPGVVKQGNQGKSKCNF